MSWLYTIVFAGLLFSSENGSISMPAAGNTNSLPYVSSVRGDETEKLDQTYPLNANGRVSVSNVNGSIVVEAWDKNEVHLEATKVADTRDRLADVEIKVDAKPDAINIEASYDNWKQRNGGDRWKNSRLEVNFHLFVPRGAVLNEVETVNGSVTVSDFSNYTKISAVNGNVRAANLRGTANLSTVNGEVMADFERLETGSNISLNTVNGSVNLLIPSDASATVRADSVNGNITNDFGLPVRKGQYVGRDLYGRIGGGDVRVKLSSVNGKLAIGRKNDGKNPSPAVNLLPQKNSDDEDWNDDADNDNDDDSMIDAAKIGKDVAKAVKESTKVSDAAVKQAQKEIAKIKPEIVKLNKEALKQAAVVLDSEEMQRQIREGMRDQEAAIARIRNIGFLGAMPRVEKKSDVIPVKGVPKVTVQAKGCSVKVRGWDRQDVQYTVTQISDNRSRRSIQMNEDHTDSTVTINVTNNDNDAMNGNFFNDLKSVRIEVFVPRKSNLKIISNGEIRLDGVSGDVELSGEDESINVRDVDGKLLIKNADGLVRVIGFKGDLNTTTVDGDVFLEGDFSRLAASGGSGSFVVTVPEKVNADIVSNASVDAEGLDLIAGGANKWRLGKGGANYNFSVTDGSVLIRNATTISAN